MTMMTKSSAIELLGWIYRRQVQETVQNIEITLPLFLMLTVFVAPADRSFSKLKHIKSYLRLGMSQDRLSNLSLISIKHEIVEKIDVDQTTCYFTPAKARKVKI